MSKADIQTTIAGYTFTWADHPVRVDVSRLHENRGELGGELKILSTEIDPPEHIHQTHFNFSSGPTRKQLAKNLAATVNHMPWSDLLEQVCVKTLEAYRMGEPVQHLTTLSEIVRPSYIINPFIVERSPNIIFGERGSLKSHLALLFLLGMELPWRGNPLGFSVPEKPIHCLILDWEQDQYTVTWLLKCISKGMDIGYIEIDYRRCYLPLANDLDQIRDAVVSSKADVIIGDSLGKAAGSDLNGTESSLGWAAGLRSLSVTSLWLAHTAKNQEGKKSVFGSQFFESEARNIWEVNKQQDEGSNEAHLLLTNTKPPPFAGTHKPMAYKIIFDDDATKFESENPDNAPPELMDRLSIRGKIYNALRYGALGLPELSEQIREDENSVKTKLNQYKNMFIHLPDGRWGLVQK